MSEVRGAPPDTLGRLAAAILLSAPTAVYLTMLGFFLAKSGASLSPVGFVEGTLFGSILLLPAWPIGGLLGWPATVLLGLPTFFMLKRVGLTAAWHMAASGALGGAVYMKVLNAAGLDDLPLLASLPEPARMLWFICCGALSGLVFWLIRRPDRDAATRPVSGNQPDGQPQPDGGGDDANNKP